MATKPSATTSISAEAGALAGGTGYCVVIAPVATNADVTPRVFSSARALLAQHDYAPGVDYSALHVDGTRKPVLFVGIPIATAGTVGRQNASGVAGTSVITVTAGANGILEETEGEVDVVTGGTIGVNGITFNLSMDGGKTTKKIRLGTATSYTVPYLGIVINFAAGTLVAGDRYTFSTTAPKWDSAGIAAAELALRGQQKLSRSWMVIGDVDTDTEAGYITTAVNLYESVKKRFTLARANVRDRLPLATLAHVGGTLTFAEVGATGDTVTRSTGSWLADGFRVGDTISFTGTVSNNVSGVIAALSATVLTFGATDLVAEVINTNLVTATKGETMAAWVSSMDAEFAPVDAQKRISIGLGRLRKASPIHGWQLRRPVQWAASIREYQHDIHRPTWTKEDGPLLDWSMTDEDDNVEEYDEDTDGGGLAGRFTCARTWGNGPLGAFIAMDLTRDTEGSLLSYTHNMNVANVCCTIVQAATEMFVGKTPRVDAAGRALPVERQVFEEAVNTDLQQALTREFVPGEGPRASMAVWRASADDVLNVVPATLTGAAELHVNGTVVEVNTVVKVS